MNDGQGDDNADNTDIAGLMYLEDEDLADRYEVAGKRSADIARTVTEVEKGNMFLAGIFASLEDMREKGRSASADSAE